MAEPAERVVTVRPRTILMVLGVTFLATAVLVLVYLAWHVITWILIALFLAAALNPFVNALVSRGMRRGAAAGIAFATALLVLTAIGFLLIPPLIRQITDFVDAVPGLVEDVTAGRGPFGFLERDYHIVDRISDAIEERGPGGVLGVTEPAVAIARSVVTAIVGIVTIAFLTLFMLLEGPKTVERFLGALPPSTAARWRRVGGEIYRTIGGYVTGNLLISFIAGTATTIVLVALGSGFAVALGLLAGILDLIPLAGATLAAVIVTLVILVELGWVQALIVGIFFIVYQQIENHLLQPLIYGRTVQMSPLAVLIAVLIGAELAGILGALAAIPVAGSLSAIVREVLEYVRERNRPGAAPAAEQPQS
jgi:predicted PurR-regulated permease PerM